MNYDINCVNVSDTVVVLRNHCAHIEDSSNIRNFCHHKKTIQQLISYQIISNNKILISNQ